MKVWSSAWIGPNLSKWSKSCFMLAGWSMTRRRASTKPRQKALVRLRRCSTSPKGRSTGWLSTNWPRVICPASMMAWHDSFQKMPRMPMAVVFMPFLLLMSIMYQRHLLSLRLRMCSA